MSGAESNNLSAVNEMDDEDMYDNYDEGDSQSSEMIGIFFFLWLILNRCWRVVPSLCVVMKEERDNLVNPYWLEDKALVRGVVDFLTGNEIQFWKDMLEKYLYPIDEDKAEQVNYSNVDSFSAILTVSWR